MTLVRVMVIPARASTACALAGKDGQETVGADVDVAKELEEKAGEEGP